MKSRDWGRQLAQLSREYFPCITDIPHLLMQIDAGGQNFHISFYKSITESDPLFIKQSLLDRESPWHYLNIIEEGYGYQVEVSKYILKIITNNFPSAFDKNKDWNLIALAGGGSAKSFLLVEASKQTLNNFCTASKTVFLSHLVRSLQAKFSTERLQSIEQEYQLSQLFFRELCQAFIPAYYKSPEQLLWVPYVSALHADKHHKVCNLNLRGKKCGFKVGLAAPWELEYFSSEVEDLYESLFDKWQLSRQHHIMIAHRIKQLAQEVEANRVQLTEWMSYQKHQIEEVNNLKRLAEQMISPRGTSSFEFYRGTESWSIRFKDDPIKLTKKYTLGLIYIHQLLLNPNKEIPCEQLYLPSKNDLKQYSPIWREIQNTYGDKAIPNDEKSWLAAITRIKTSLPNASKELSVKLLEYLIFLSEQLYRSNASKQNLARMLDYRKELKLAKLELEPGKGDQRFYRNEVTMQGILRKNSEHDIIQRRIYQNVTKAVSRTIKTMNHQGIRKYFKETLQIGRYCAYYPDNVQPEHPAWKLWME